MRQPLQPRDELAMLLLSNLAIEIRHRCVGRRCRKCSVDSDIGFSGPGFYSVPTRDGLITVFEDKTTASVGYIPTAALNCCETIERSCC